MPAEGSSTRETYVGRTIRDPTDMRDLIYRPTLGLLPECFLGAAMRPKNIAYRKNLKIRNQGAAPSCIGESLAALVDIQRIETYFKARNRDGAQKSVFPASGPMLHAMAIEIESFDQGKQATEIYSLRSGLRGFYNNGVCTEDTWNETNKGKPPPEIPKFDAASVDVMQEARNVTLGAYFRVQSFMNDYHAALIEAGALYVSADLHDGWKTPVKGVIASGGANNVYSGGHAFVIVGYEKAGFLVLNSWGREWGGYAFNGGPPMEGIALWKYEDWAACVIDAWVLRLAAPTPDSFRFTVGPQGTTMFGADQGGLAAPSVRRLEVLGHYIHLDDGRHVETGSYPSSRDSLKKTLDYLKTDPKKRDVTDIRLTIHGDDMPTQAVMARIARSHSSDKAANVHGVSLLWVNGLLSGSSDALQPLFDAALAIARNKQDDADKRIESMTRPVGRALWRDAKRSAARAVARKPDGDATDALAQIVQLCKDTGKRLHLVSEGAGILLLAALLRGGKDPAARDKDLADVLFSITLVAPLITKRDFDDSVGRFLEFWGGPRQERRATLFRANATLDERLSIGNYSRSWTDLISRSFEDISGEHMLGKDMSGSSREEPQILIAAHNFKADLRGNPECVNLTAPRKADSDLKGPSAQQRELAVSSKAGSDLTSALVLQHEKVTDHVAKVIKDFQRKQPVVTKQGAGKPALTIRTRRILQ